MEINIQAVPHLRAKKSRLTKTSLKREHSIIVLLGMVKF